jgi:hypothetical protein
MAIVVSNEYCCNPDATLDPLRAIVQYVEKATVTCAVAESYPSTKDPAWGNQDDYNQRL